jgi:TolA-binding protein
MTSISKLFIIAVVALVFDFRVQVDAAGTMSSTAPANAAAASLSSSSTSSSSTTTTSHQGLCDYADALDELERELGSSGTTTFIMRHETKLNQQNHHRHHQPHNLFLGDELSEVEHNIVQRKIHRKEHHQHHTQQQSEL